MNESTSCAAPVDTALGADEAVALIIERIQPVGEHERVPLQRSRGRVLAQDLISPMDVPPHRNAAMDGYALRASDLTDAGGQLWICGEAFAGHPFDGEVPAGACVRIMTGAPMPAALDTVIMQEQVTRDGDWAQFDQSEKRAANVREPGEDIARGALVLSAGTRITPARMGLLASLGLTELSVRRRIRVACFSSGDEVREPGSPLLSGEIYDSNRFVLLGLLEMPDIETIDLGLIPDRADLLAATMRDAAAQADLVLSSGGVSVGEANHIAENIRALCRIEFSKLAIKPGRPLTFAALGDAWFFGLPGNPVAVMTTFHQFVEPALRRLGGEPAESAGRRLRLPAQSLDRLRHKPGRTEFQRGQLGRDERGQTTVKLSGRQGSGVLTSMSAGDCFIVLPPSRGNVEPGEEVLVEPFRPDR